MRSEAEMVELILGTARADERIRAVLLNGSRANPNAPKDCFQDFDVVYIVTEVESFLSDPHWIERFGELMILQLPDTMGDSEETRPFGDFGYLAQFAEGNRIDLTMWPLAHVADIEEDSLTVLLLDKDGIVPALPPASDRDYLPKPPTPKAFADCCNEFWWVCPYVAKGLWREELPYAKAMAEEFVRPQLMKMLTWHVGVRTGFAAAVGKQGKYLQRYLEPELWEMLLRTYADADYGHTWDALLAMGALFRRVALGVAAHFGYAYPEGDDARVSAHLHHVRKLPRDAREMY